jgi:hypothetical protein
LAHQRISYKGFVYQLVIKEETRKLKDSVVFLLQEHNSIDQIAPVIDMLLDDNKQIILIATVHDYDYYSDKNIKFLLNKGASISFYDLFLNQNKIYKFLSFFWIRFKIFLETRTPIRGILYRLLCRIPSMFMKFYLALFTNKTVVATTAFAKLQQRYQFKLVVTEVTTGNDFYTSLIVQANLLGLVNISFTHGFQVLTNELLSINDLDYKLASSPKQNPSMTYADFAIVFNSIAKKHLLSFAGRNINNVIQLPSLRYTSEWIDKKLAQDDKFKSISCSAGKVKIVFMLSALNYNIWTDEQLRVAKSILMRKDCILTIKTHPRSTQQMNDFKKLKSKYENLELIGHEISSSSLIEWADVVISIGSGIAMEAIIRRKPLLYAKYLHANSTVFDACEAVAMVADTRDDVHRWIDYVKNGDYNILDTQYIKFLSDYIANDDYAENQGAYKNFLLRCLTQESMADSFADSSK